MICVKTWEKKTADSFSEWDKWLEFVNSNLKFCRTQSSVWDFLGKCENWELPSEHPYWSHVLLDNTRNDLVKLCKLYEECKVNPDKIKYYFNRNTTLMDIEKMVLGTKKKIADYESEINYG